MSRQPERKSRPELRQRVGRGASLALDARDGSSRRTHLRFPSLVAGLLLASGSLLTAFPSFATEADAAAGNDPSEESFQVNPTGRAKPPKSDPDAAPGLDSLLQLPSGYLRGQGQQVAGATEPEWRRRFRVANTEMAESLQALETAKRELDGVALEGGSQWSVAPPGASPSAGGPSGGAASGSGGPVGAATSPLSFRLRQELLRSRERVEAAERSLRALRIEADLAGVPKTWRGQPEEAARTELE